MQAKTISYLLVKRILYLQSYTIRIWLILTQFYKIGLQGKDYPHL